MFRTRLHIMHIIQYLLNLHVFPFQDNICRTVNFYLQISWNISIDKYFYFSQFTNKDISCHDKIFTIIFQTVVFIVLCGRNITRVPVPLQSHFFSTFIMLRPFLRCPKTYRNIVRYKEI